MSARRFFGLGGPLFCLLILALIGASAHGQSSNAAPSRQRGPASSRRPNLDRAGTSDSSARSAVPERAGGSEASSSSATNVESSASNKPLPDAGRTAAAPGSAPETRAGSAGGHDYSAFKIIADRNIFDTNRRARGRDTGEAPKPKRVDTISLVGTLTSEKGTYAFFDGSSSEFRKVLEPGKRIATFELESVGGNEITLKSGTNTLHLTIGAQLRREEEGDWVVSGGSSSGATSNASPSSAAPSADDDNDIVKRLMRQREQELK
jgi:hypothetical protein